MFCVTNQRQSRSGLSSAAGPPPLRSSIQHGDGQAACADARHGRRPSPSSTGPTLAALPPEALIAARRSTFPGAGRWSRMSAHPKGMARCYARRWCRISRLDLGSGEEDGNADVRPSRRRIRSRRRRPCSVAVSDSVVVAADVPPPSSMSVCLRGCPRAANARPSLSGASPDAGPGPAPLSPEHGDGQATCAEARHGRRPSPSGTDRSRAPTPGFGVAPLPSRWGRPWWLCRPRHASLRAVPPLAGRGAVHQSAPVPEGRLVATRAGGAGSVGSISGRGKRTATPMTAGYGIGTYCGGAACDRAPSSPSVLQFWMVCRRYRSSPACVLRSPQYLLPLSLALRDTRRVLSCPVLVAN